MYYWHVAVSTQNNYILEKVTELSMSAICSACDDLLSRILVKYAEVTVHFTFLRKAHAYGTKRPHFIPP